MNLITLEMPVALYSLTLVIAGVLGMLIRHVIQIKLERERHYNFVPGPLHLAPVEADENIAGIGVMSITDDTIVIQITRQDGDIEFFSVTKTGTVITFGHNNVIEPGKTPKEIEAAMLLKMYNQWLGSKP